MKDPALFDRWVKFNGVGMIGVGVQLAVLGALVRGLGVHYLLATAVAVEAAVLHNFLWHGRWTWRDRPASGPGSLLRRAAEFHLLNGAISMAGNLGLMRVLTGSMHLDPIASNIVAVIVCSLANFAASEWVVFRRTATAALLLLLVQPVSAAGPTDMTPPVPEIAASAVELQPRTVQSWQAYERQVDSRYGSASATRTPFFALDAFAVKDWRPEALRGGITMARIDRALPGGSQPDVPDGKIHHWAGAVFVPGTTVPAVLERLSHLAGSESKHYEDVIGSRLLSRDGDRYTVFLKLRRSKVITVTYNSEHVVNYLRLGATRASARSVSTRIAELENSGTPQEREKQIGSDGGYLWRLNAYWRYEAVNGGVLIECESVSLSRAVPMLLKPFISGIVEGLARESLERTLSGLRKTLTGPVAATGRQPADLT
jgi:putative flippase GtrA